MAKLKISVLPIDTIIDELKYLLVKRADHQRELNRIMKKHPNDYGKYLIYDQHLNQFRRLNKEIDLIIDEIKRRTQHGSK